MLLCSIDASRSYFNGVYYVTKAFHTKPSLLESSTGDNAGKGLALPKRPFGPRERTFHMYAFTRIRALV